MDSDLNHTALELISKEWSQLRAQYVRILVPGQSFPQGIPDQYIYATSFSEPPEFNDKSLTLQVATYEDFDWCCQALGDAYKHTWQTVRELSANNLVAVDDEELCDHISEREVYIIYENDVRAGLLICQKGNIAFLRGYRITDKVILPAFRGRSLSARAQRLLYRLLTHSDSELSLYMGTIIPRISLDENCRKSGTNLHPKLSISTHLQNPRLTAMLIYLQPTSAFWHRGRPGPGVLPGRINGQDVIVITQLSYGLRYSRIRLRSNEGLTASGIHPVP